MKALEMKTTKYTEEQIIGALKQLEAERQALSAIAGGWHGKV